ncbi:MAG: metallophosphoesterase [Eubacteriales bacterium]|nr:metallophosphoesterase [Eubacteriales bacterium]MDD4474643.1 metallophosphoesterase [Eubacteriales bacterium]
MKFAFLTDTHVGASPMMFSQQKGYPENLDTLAKILAEKIKDEGISFVLHGGDIVDSTKPEFITKAADLFAKLGVPVYLTLGNHDVTTPDSLEQWKSFAGCFFPESNPEYTIAKEQLRIHVISTHWEDLPYFWATRQDAHFLSKRVEELKDKISKEPDAIHIICTHSPVFPIPCEQTGFDLPFHNPGETFGNSVLSITESFPNIKCVLSGHNHVNTCNVHNGVHYITASSFSETPFEFKVFELDGKTLKMKTVSLLDKADFGFEYNFGKTFVQGREKDRMFSIKLN